MTIHIGTVETEIVGASSSTDTSDEGSGTNPVRDGSSPWPLLERVRDASARLARARARLRAEDFDD